MKYWEDYHKKDGKLLFSSRWYQRKITEEIDSSGQRVVELIAKRIEHDPEIGSFLGNLIKRKYLEAGKKIITMSKLCEKLFSRRLVLERILKGERNQQTDGVLNELLAEAKEEAG